MRIMTLIAFWCGLQSGLANEQIWENHRIGVDVFQATLDSQSYATGIATSDFWDRHAIGVDLTVASELIPQVSNVFGINSVDFPKKKILQSNGILVESTSLRATALYGGLRFHVIRTDSTTWSLETTGGVGWTGDTKHKFSNSSGALNSESGLDGGQGFYWSGSLMFSTKIGYDKWRLNAKYFLRDYGKMEGHPASTQTIRSKDIRVEVKGASLGLSRQF